MRNNRTYCIKCRNVHALKQLMSSKSKENTFITIGFNNWKDATCIFEHHRKSACYKEAVMKWDQHNKGTSINSQLNSQRYKYQFSDSEQWMTNPGSTFDNDIFVLGKKKVKLTRGDKRKLRQQYWGFKDRMKFWRDQVNMY